MSTILDALKKSEQERKRNNVPTLSDMPAPQENSRWPFVVLFITGLLLITLLGLAINYLWFSETARSTDRETKLVLSNETLGGEETQQAGVQSDEEVVVNVVSYSDDPLQRFAMINGKLFRENEFVRAGLKVEEIKRDSVVLNQRGRRVERQP